ncbi:hypothetical protein STEG23_015208, partial [Scotinomys teguina]
TWKLLGYRSPKATSTPQNSSWDNSKKENHSIKDSFGVDSWNGLPHLPPFLITSILDTRPSAGTDPGEERALLIKYFVTAVMRCCRVTSGLESRPPWCLDVPELLDQLVEDHIAGLGPGSFIGQQFWKQVIGQSRPHMLDAVQSP